MPRLSGTRALVTGATTGLGRAMAQALADAGARVAVTSRDAARAQEAALAIGPNAPFPSRPATPAARAPDRPVTATDTPASASAAAIARPSPVVEPVTSARTPSSGAMRGTVGDTVPAP